MTGETPNASEADLAGRELRLQYNWRAMASIVDTVYLCGRQNFALRGHRDDSQYLGDPNHNPGNFLALLEFRVRCF